MPKKLFNINNYTDGFHVSKLGSGDTPVSSNIKGFKVMRNLDPCSKIGALVPMKAPGISSLPSSQFGSVETISAPDKTYVNNLLVFRSDYDYASAPSGDYTCALTQNYGTYISSRPKFECQVTLDEAKAERFINEYHGPREDCAIGAMIETSGDIGAGYGDPPGSGVQFWFVGINSCLFYDGDGYVEGFPQHIWAIPEDGAFFYNAGSGNNMTNVLTQLQASTEANDMTGAGIADTDIDITEHSASGYMHIEASSDDPADWGGTYGVGFDEEVNRKILFHGHFWWMHPNYGGTEPGDYHYQKAQNFWHWEGDWWENNDAHPEYESRYLNTGEDWQREYWANSPWECFTIPSFVYSSIGATYGYTPQIITCSVTAPANTGNNFVYRTTINGTAYDYTTNAGASTSEAIVDELVIFLTSEIADFTAVKISSSGDIPAVFTLTGQSDGAGFTYSVELLPSESTPYVSTERPTDFVVVADGSSGSSHIFNSITNLWSYDGIIMDVQDQGTNVHLSYIQNAIRACDTSFNYANKAKWHGFIKRSFFGTAQTSGNGNANNQTSILAWHLDDCSLDALGVAQIRYNLNPLTPTEELPISLRVVRTSMSGNWDGYYDFAVSTLYDDIKQESLLSGVTALNITTDTVGFELLCHSIVSQSYQRVSGFRIYARKQGNDRWYLQAEVSMGLGMKTVEEDTHAQWADGDFAENVSKCTSLIGGDTIARMESYEVMTGHSPDIPACSFDTVTTGWVTNAYVNGRCYYGNLRMKDLNGDVIKMADSMVRSEVGKADVVCADNMVTIIADDGESIRALVGVGNKLLQFKEETLYVIDTSSGYEILEKKYKYLGARCQHAIAEVPDGVVWINNYGLWQYTANGGVRDLSLDKSGISRINKKGGILSTDNGGQGYCMYDPATEWIYFFMGSDLHYGYAYHRLFGTIINLSVELFGDGSSTYSDGDNEYWMNTWSNPIVYKNKTIFGNNFRFGGTLGGIKFGTPHTHAPICNAIGLDTGDMALGDTSSKKKIKKYVVKWKNVMDGNGRMKLSHTENGGAYGNSLYTIDDYWDGQQLTTTTNTITNSGFETEGASATLAEGWTLTANTNGTSLQRTADTSAGLGDWVIKEIQSATATAGTAGLLQSSTGFSIAKPSVNSIHFDFKLVMDAGTLSRTVLEANPLFIQIRTPSGGSGGEATYWNRVLWEWQTTLYEGDTMQTMGSYGSIFDDDDNVIQNMWHRLQYGLSAISGTGFDHAVNDAIVTIILPKINSCSIYINDIVQINSYVSTQVLSSQLTPTAFVEDPEGDIYSTSMEISPFGDNLIYNQNLAGLEIYDIGVLYRERKTK